MEYVQVQQSTPQTPILIVDDDPGLCQMMQWVLEEEDFVVATVEDGQEAVEWMTCQSPVLVILDMGLPIIDGEGVAKALHSLYGLKIPIICVTADGHAAEKARRIGAQSYLHKPFELDDLLHHVHQALSLH